MSMQRAADTPGTSSRCGWVQSVGVIPASSGDGRQIGQQLPLLVKRRIAPVEAVKRCRRIQVAHGLAVGLEEGEHHLVGTSPSAPRQSWRSWRGASRASVSDDSTTGS